MKPAPILLAMIALSVWIGIEIDPSRDWIAYLFLIAVPFILAIGLFIIIWRWITRGDGSSNRNAAGALLPIVFVSVFYWGQAQAYELSQPPESPYFDHDRFVTSLRYGLEHTEVRAPAVLPDRHYADEQCSRVQSYVDRGVSYERSEAEGIDREAVGRFVAESRRLAEICKSYYAGLTTGDELFAQLEIPVAALASECLHPRACLIMMRKTLWPVEMVPDGFDTYSLFMVTSEEWSEAQQAGRTEFDALFYAFQDFGDAIGDRKLAVWLGNPSFRDRDITPPDVVRAKSYADRFGLNYNDGPFVVTTRQRPDLVADGDEIVVIKLRGLNGQGIIRVLNVLEQDLRRGQDIRRRALIFEEVKQRVLQVARNNSDLLEAILLKIVD